ncbi:MAG: hypothetical protein R2873_07475 [Caldilineaceae bacterium]
MRWMEEVIIPFQISKGMVVLGSFTGEQEDDLYVWIRRFNDEEERKALYAAVYESDFWKNESLPKSRIPGPRKNRGDAAEPHAEISAPVKQDGQNFDPRRRTKIHEAEEKREGTRIPRISRAFRSSPRRTAPLQVRCICIGVTGKFLSLPS